MRIWYASIFLSLLAGKLSQIEQSAGVTQFMEIFQTQKKSDHVEKQTLNQRMCKRHKVRLRFFFGRWPLIDLLKRKKRTFLSNSDWRCCSWYFQLIQTIVLRWFHVCRRCWLWKSFYSISIKGTIIGLGGVSLLLSSVLVSKAVWKEKQKSECYGRLLLFSLFKNWQSGSEAEVHRMAERFSWLLHVA